MKPEEKNFIKTISLLMGLTRKEKVQWHEKESPLLTMGDPLPTYEAKFNEMKFSLQDAGDIVPNPTKLLRGGKHLKPGVQYRLVITDLNDSNLNDPKTISSPPLKAAADLVAVIQTKAKKREEVRSEDLNSRLGKINKRLAAAS